MVKRLLLFTIAFLLILTFALAQQVSNNNNASGNHPNHGGQPTKNDQQHNGGKHGRPNNNSGNNHNHGHGNHRHRRGHITGMVFSILAYIISGISLIIACAATIAFIILKKKGYTISIHKKEASHQPLREEEEELSSQYLPQVPVVNPVVNVMMQQPQQPQSTSASVQYSATQPIVGVYYPNLQQQPIQQENSEQKV